MGSVVFDFPPQVARDYLLGDCGALALLLHRHFGAVVYALFERGPRRDIRPPVHYAAKVGNLYVDITGARPRSDFIERAALALNQIDGLSLSRGNIGITSVDPKI